MPKNLDYDNGWNLCGSQCSWCGKRQEQRYLFPVLLVRGKETNKQLNLICVECIASQNIPKDVKSDLPWYDPMERRIFDEKTFVSFPRSNSTR